MQTTIVNQISAISSVRKMLEAFKEGADEETKKQLESLSFVLNDAGATLAALNIAKAGHEELRSGKNDYDTSALDFFDSLIGIDKKKSDEGE